MPADDLLQPEPEPESEPPARELIPQRAAAGIEQGETPVCADHKTPSLLSTGHFCSRMVYCSACR